MLIVLQQKVIRYSTRETLAVDVVINTDDIQYIRYSDCDIRVIEQSFNGVCQPMKQGITLVDIIYKNGTIVQNIIGSVKEIYDIICKASK